MTPCQAKTTRQSYWQEGTPEGHLCAEEFGGMGSKNIKIR